MAVGQKQTQPPVQPMYGEGVEEGHLYLPPHIHCSTFSFQFQVGKGRGQRTWGGKGIAELEH